MRTTLFSCAFQLDALEYIHENSYVHADVKASNCLLGYKAGKPDSDVVCVNQVFDKSGLLLAKLNLFLHSKICCGYPQEAYHMFR